jgi:internalin A
MRDEAYRRAEREIEEAWRSGATELDLRSMRLGELPESVGRLTWLKSLNLSGNKLTVLPESVERLTELVSLDFSDNRLAVLPESLGRLTPLQSLNLRSNQLMGLPEGVGQLTELRSLNLSSNKLAELPQRLNRLTQLRELAVSDNDLRELPEWLSQLTALKQLYINDIYLSTLPPEIGRLKGLTGLYALDAQLRSLPEEIGQLTKLEDLFIGENHLVTLPREMGNLRALKRLWVPNNQLTTLPPEIRQLSLLKVLNLHGNPGLGLPEDVLGPVEVTGVNAKRPQEILDYYFSTRGDEGVALREMKLIVVGWGKAGKTTLVKRMTGTGMDPTEPETHGIVIRPLTLHCTDGDLKARVWDFGGQHVLHAMHEFFLTARSLYLLVIEQRGDRAEADAKYWLQLIRSYAPKAPVVVALNKSQCVERPLDRESLEKLYGPIVAWVATECLPEDDCPGASATIAALRAALTAAAEEATMPEPRKRFPKKWVAIKEWLEGLDETGTNFVDYDTFSRECSTRGEPDPEKQAEVAALMHDLGVAMNYARDERLRDTTVLRPDWLANGIYAVLRANLFVPGRPLARDAVLTAEKLGEVYAVAAQKPVEMLKAKDYPAEKWEFLLRLMNLFQLSFPLNEHGSRQLCPTLLRAEPPPGTDEPEGTDTVRLRYEFAVVPAPLLPRFMVRTFSLIEQSKLWQRGAILRYPDARARVWTTPEEKYLFVTVGGPEGDRTDLLSIIRSTLAELFAEYRDLKVTEQRWFDGQWVPRKTLEKFGVLEREWEEGAREESL